MAAGSIRKIRANRRSVIVAVIVTLMLAAFLSVAAVRLYRENRILQNNKELMEQRITEEEARKASMEAQDGKGLSKEEAEQIARDRYHLVYPDEIILTPEE